METETNVNLTVEELRFIEGCVYDSEQEGHFDFVFGHPRDNEFADVEIDTDKCFYSLVLKGIIRNRHGHPEDLRVLERYRLESENRSANHLIDKSHGGE
jgi:hypothetical protein